MRTTDYEFAVREEDVGHDEDDVHGDDDDMIRVKVGER